MALTSAVRASASGSSSNDARILIIRRTGYADQDNDPPGTSDIAYPKSRKFPTVHTETGGTGTYDDPITIAGDIREVPAGTRIYDVRMRLYGVLEDYCQASVDEHDGPRLLPILDYFVGGKGATADRVDAYERSITEDGVEVILNPPRGLPVIVGPLYETKRRKAGNPPGSA
jgi:hypothetical protein